MSHLSQEEVKHHVKIYVRVFVALAVLTVLTVAVSYFHFPVLWAVLIALVIASFKASLVAAFFMHLSGEKRIILAILLLTVLFFLFVLVLPSVSHY
jgi:cytochrome c oxidase subunit 4